MGGAGRTSRIQIRSFRKNNRKNNRHVDPVDDVVVDVLDDDVDSLRLAAPWNLDRHLLGVFRIVVQGPIIKD